MTEIVIILAATALLLVIAVWWVIVNAKRHVIEDVDEQRDMVERCREAGG